MDYPEPIAAMPGTDREHPYTVTGLTHEIRNRIEGMRTVWLTGEVTALMFHSSHHVYLTIKDSDNQISGVIWRSTAKDMQLELRDGMKVLASGQLAVYGARSRYQITIQSIEAQGIGSLLLAIENLKKKLAGLGLFDPARKRRLPYIPRKICVVTSPTGAAVHDILNVIERRCPKIAILIYPVKVQGEAAANQVTEAIRTINQAPEFSDVDVMIVGRGGGNPEDLWTFNDEKLAYAIFESRIPVVSAVGHEIDTTISDLVADRRALTPTEAGELVVPCLDEVCRNLERKKQQLDLAMMHRLKLCHSMLQRISSHRAMSSPLEKIGRARQRLDILQQRMQVCTERLVQKKSLLLTQASGKLLSHEPSLKLQRYRQRLDELSSRLSNSICKRTEWERRRAKNFEAQLEALSPISVLRRGYSITYPKKGDAVVRDHSQVTPGDYIWTRLANSWILSKVERTGVKSVKPGGGTQ